MLGQAVGHTNITCASTELVTIEPPSGQTCGEYMSNYIQLAGGYLTNEDATSSCEYCTYRTTDAFLEESFNIYYSNHWRDFGIFCAYIVFNVSCLTRSLLGSGADRILNRSAVCTFFPGCSASSLEARLGGSRVASLEDPEQQSFISIRFNGQSSSIDAAGGNQLSRANVWNCI